MTDTLWSWSASYLSGETARESRFHVEVSPRRLLGTHRRSGLFQHQYPQLIAETSQESTRRNDAIPLLGFEKAAWEANDWVGQIEPAQQSLRPSSSSYQREVNRQSIASNGHTRASFSKTRV